MNQEYLLWLQNKVKVWEEFREYSIVDEKTVRIVVGIYKEAIEEYIIMFEENKNGSN